MHLLSNTFVWECLCVWSVLVFNRSNYIVLWVFLFSLFHGCIASILASLNDVHLELFQFFGIIHDAVASSLYVYSWPLVNISKGRIPRNEIADQILSVFYVLAGNSKLSSKTVVFLQCINRPFPIPSYTQLSFIFISPVE